LNTKHLKFVLVILPMSASSGLRGKALTTKIPSIIALCGVKRSGKDTVVNFIESLYPDCYVHCKISTQLKQIVKIMFSFSTDQIEAAPKDEIDLNWQVSPRDAMQFIGTDMMQMSIANKWPHIGRKFWIINFIKTLPCNKSIIISDLRFLHEYEELLKITDNLHIIKIQRHDNPKGDLKNNHLSETELNTIPYNTLINNDGTLEDLQKKVQALTNQLKLTTRV
jgi:hypothetical protein